MPILITNIDLLKQSYLNILQYYEFDLIAYSIQPNHIHCMIKPLNIEDYPKIVKSLKYTASNQRVIDVNKTLNSDEVVLFCD